MRHIIPISGKDSLATALWLRARYPDLPYEYMHNDTFTEPPEVDGWLERVEQHLGSPIVKVGKDLAQIIRDQGVLPSHKMRYCTRLSKIFPMEDYLGQTDATVYIGMRADEMNRAGYTPTTDNITVRYPLREDGIGLQQVYTIVEKADLMPPTFFWPSMLELVLEILGPDADFINALTSIEYAQLFAWRSRPNCVFCFYGRLYEYVGLLEIHPDLFFRLFAGLEQEVGADDYHWREDYPYTRFLDPAEQKRIKWERAKQIVAYIYAKVQKRLFDDTPYDALTFVSCGNFCGK